MELGILAKSTPEMTLMNKKIKLWYTDFYKGFDPASNPLQNFLAQHYNIHLDPKEPEYLFYSCYGSEFLSYEDPVKIFYTGENLIPDFNLCDYAIGFGYLELEDRHLRYPNFALIADQFEKLLKTKSFTREDLSKKENFCNFIYSNSNADPSRDDFFHLLSQYKKVDSPGRHLNNITLDVGNRFSEDWMYTKLNFQSRCKFSVAFENTSSPGYTTEKLMHAFITDTIPIYWGNPKVTRDFNSKSFINAHDFSSLKDVVQKVAEIDTNNDLALEMLNQPPFPGNVIPQNLKQVTLNEFLRFIFDQDLKYAYRRPRFGTTKNYEKEIRELRQIREKNSKNSVSRKFLKLLHQKGIRGKN